MGDQIIFSHGSTNLRGVAILFKHGANYKIHKVNRDDKGRVLIIDVSLNNQHVTFCNLYAPNEDSLEFFSDVCVCLDLFNNPQKVIAGDLNLCFNIDKDKRGMMYNNIKALEVLKLYMEENYMLDVWRMKNLESFAFTWKRKAPTAVMSRLDNFLVTSGTVGWIDNIYIKPGLRNDHLVTGMELYPKISLEEDDFGNSIPC